MRPLATVFLAGCFAETHRPTCERDPAPVADDVEVAGASGAALIGQVEGVRVGPGRYDDGAPAEVTVEVRRTGDAERVETTPGDASSRHLGFGDSYLMVYVPCGDYVRVPVELRVTTADGATDVLVEHYVEGPMEGEVEWSGADALWVSGDAPIDHALLPLGADDPADYDDPYAFAQAIWPGDGGPTTGRAGWGGSQETEESSSSRAFYLLEW